MIAGIRIMQSLRQRLESITENREFDSQGKNMSNTRKMLDEASAIFETSGVLDGILRTKMLMADLLEIAGDANAAKEVAGEVYPTAAAMSYLGLADRANDLLSGNTLLMRFTREWNATKDLDDDALFAILTDDQVREFAKDSLRMNDLPDDRLPVAEEYCRSLREVAKERLNWCRHIALLEDLQQTRELKVAFCVVPNRKCFCQRYAYSTETVSSDSTTLISSFKREYCATCSDRCPKSGA